MDDRIRRSLTIAARVLLATAIVVTMYEATIRHPVNVELEQGDKMLHALAFLGLSFLVDFAFPGEGFGFRKIILVIGYGVLIEAVQLFLPWRSTELADIVADCAGIALYGLLIPLLRYFPLLRHRWYRD